jgi:hypothetical protein
LLPVHRGESGNHLVEMRAGMGGQATPSMRRGGMIRIGCP